MEDKNHCPNCGGATCPHCGKAQPACSTHCYCQAVYIGSAYHKVCCKCGDRVAATAPNPYPVYPYYPTWYWNQATAPKYIVTNTNQTTGYSHASKLAGTPMEGDLVLNPDTQRWRVIGDEP